MPATPFRPCGNLSFLPDYRLAPEHPFTAALISSVEVLAITRFTRISKDFTTSTILANSQRRAFHFFQ